jgi:thiamine-monophosphate kinase
VPYGAGPEAADLGATSMIDVSDGLLADRRSHRRRQRRGASTCARTRSRWPAQMRDAAAALGVDPYTVAAGGWRRPRRWPATFPAGTELPTDWLAVGQVRESPAPEVTVDGRQFGDGAGGWDHFR